MRSAPADCAWRHLIVHKSRSHTAEEEQHKKMQLVDIRHLTSSRLINSATPSKCTCIPAPDYVCMQNTLTHGAL